MKKLIQRIKYWFTHPHHCQHCCVLCKYYDICKQDTEEDRGY